MKCRHKVTNEVSAVKELNGRSIQEQAFLQEVGFLASFRHPALVGIIGYVPPCWASHQRAQIVMEWMPNGNLSDIMKDGANAVFDDTRKVKIVVGVCMAMRYIHAAGGIHRDLKPSNVLLDENYEPRLADFGSATFMWRDATATAAVGTRLYAAPEADTSTYNQKMDVFSFGMMLWEILTGVHLCEAFKGTVRTNDVVGWKKHIEKGNRPPLFRISKAGARLLEKCWADSPDARFTFGAIVDYLHSTGYQLLPNVDVTAIRTYVNRINSFEAANPASKVDVGWGCPEE